MFGNNKQNARCPLVLVGRAFIHPRAIVDRFFLKFLLQSDNELLVLDMQKKIGGHR